MRSTGSLLVRALAVGGLTAAAWLVGGAVASASPVDHAPDSASVVDFVHSTIAEHRSSLEDTGINVRDISEQWTTALADLGFPDQARVPAEDEESDAEEPSPDVDDEFFENASPVYYSGGVISSGTERSGTISNSMPEEMYTAKVAAKVAARLAAAPVPVPVEVEVPVEVAVAVPSTAVVAPQWSIPAIHVSAPVVELDNGSAAGGPEWETPRPAAPAPAPQPAQAPTAPTASSSGHDNPGGARGGIAVTTAQSGPHQPSTWTVERRDDWRTPGSVQGLPNSSPD